MKNNPLKIVYSLLAGIAYAVLMGALVGGGDTATVWTVATFSFVGGIILSYGYSPRDRRAMAYTCGAITSGITLSCDDPLESGVRATFYIANKDDIASISYDPANPMLADAITMQAGKSFFEVQGQLQSTEPNFVMVKGKYVNNFEHTVSFLIFKIDPATKKEVNNMKDGNFVCIVTNNYTGATGNCKYEIYGAGGGLKAEVLERNPADAETLGAYKVSLKTQEYAREAKPPVTFFDTNAATTETAIAALL
jgi:hypothetical protein